MKVVLVTPYYPPEISGGAHLICELALSLKDLGHEITVLTAYPKYNIKTVQQAYRQGLRMDEVLEGIPIRRIRLPQMPRASRMARGLEHFAFGIWLGALATRTPRSDVLIAFSPPLPIPWVICRIGRARRMPVVVNIQDLFPREAVEMGMLSNPLLIRMFEAMERRIYRLAAAVTVHSPGNAEHVLERGGDRDRVHVLYNWVDINRIRPGDRDNDFARRHGLGDRFVTSYAGNMGWAQDMGTIISCASLLRSDPGILFLLVGDGVEKDKAQARSREMGLQNILWLPIQPWSVYPEILKASDASLINLNPDLRTPVVPSKLLSIMAAGRPVVASVPKESDARRIIAEAGCGLCVDAGDADALAGVIQKLASDRERASEMGRRGRAYAEAHFSRDACTRQMEAILKNAAGKSL